MVRLTSCIVFIAIALTCVLADEEKYSDQYDDFDVNNIFTNEKLQIQYYKCFMDQEPCKTAPMRFFKAIFPEAFATQCRKCTDKQKVNLEKIIEWYTTNKPDQWNALVTKMLLDASKKS